MEQTLDLALYIDPQDPQILDLSNWCASVEKEAHEYGQSMEHLYDEPLEYDTSYKETKEMAIDELIQMAKKSNIDKTSIKTVYVTQEFLNDYNGYYEPSNGALVTIGKADAYSYSKYNISSKYMKNLMKLFPNAAVSVKNMIN